MEEGYEMTIFAKDEESKKKLSRLIGDEKGWKKVKKPNEKVSKKKPKVRDVPNDKKSVSYEKKEDIYSDIRPILA